jgi:hypothetical protein
MPEEWESKQKNTSCKLYFRNNNCFVSGRYLKKQANKYENKKKTGTEIGVPILENTSKTTVRLVSSKTKLDFLGRIQRFLC